MTPEQTCLQLLPLIRAGDDELPLMKLIRTLGERQAVRAAAQALLWSADEAAPAGPAGDTRVTPWKPFEHQGVTHARMWQHMAAGGLLQRPEYRDAAGASTWGKWVPAPSSWIKAAVSVVEGAA